MCNYTDYTLYTVNRTQVTSGDEACTAVKDYFQDDNVQSYSPSFSAEIQTKHCNEIKFDTTYYSETIATEYGLVCDRYAMVELLQIGVMIGVLIGAIGFGKMSDSIGRRPATLCSWFTCLCGSIPMVFVPGNLISKKFSKKFSKKYS